MLFLQLLGGLKDFPIYKVGRCMLITVFEILEFQNTKFPIIIIIMMENIENPRFQNTLILCKTTSTPKYTYPGNRYFQNLNFR